MDNYKCDKCNYITKRQDNYNRHIKSNKHLKNVTRLTNNESINKNNLLLRPKTPQNAPKRPKTSKMRPKIFEEPLELGQLNCVNQVKQKIVCEYCDMEFCRTSNLMKHKKICTNLKTKNMEESYKSEIEILNTKVDKYKSESYHYKEEINYYKQMLREAGGLVKKSVSSLTYAMDNYNNAPAIKTITIQEIDSFDNSEKKIVEDILSSYKHKTLGKYLGDFILKLYKKDDPKDQSIWNTDDNRLTYLIKELLNNESSNWIVDKKGIKTQTYLIEPLLAHIKSLLVSYQTNFNIPDIGKNSIELEMMLENSKKIIELTNDIDDGFVSKDILKHISSYLKFNGKIIE